MLFNCFRPPGESAAELLQRITFSPREFTNQYDTAKVLNKLINEVPWVKETEARSECFMGPEAGTVYTYGAGKGVRSYTSVPYHRIVQYIGWNLDGPIHTGNNIDGTFCGGRCDIVDQTLVCSKCDMQDWGPTCGPYNADFLKDVSPSGLDFNVCFLNRYDNQRQALGWHSDDSPGMLHTHPIDVVSFGATRELWVRPIGHKGEIPAEWRFSLSDGSHLRFPPHFQQCWQHKIVKASQPVGTRISLTFRRYVRDEDEMQNEKPEFNP